jgi:hypothetical protein
MKFTNVTIPLKGAETIEKLLETGAKVRRKIIRKLIDKAIFKLNIVEALTTRFIPWSRLHERWRPSTTLWTTETFRIIWRLPSTVIASMCRYLSNGWPTSTRFGEEAWTCLACGQT